MKAISTKSKRAFLIFFSAITLTLIATVTLPLSFAGRRPSISIVHQKQTALIHPQIQSALQTGIWSIAASAVFFYILTTTQPWAGTVAPRAPPR